MLGAQKMSNSSKPPSSLANRFRYVHQSGVTFRIALAILWAFYASSAAAGLGPCHPDTIQDAWWTGPIAAPSPATLPRGHFLLEPYVYDARVRGQYDSSGKVNQSSRGNNVGSSTYALYGIRDHLSAGLIYSMEYDGHRQDAQSAFGGGDPIVLIQYRLTQPKPCESRPIVAVNVRESLPMARYDRLLSDRETAFGSGTFGTSFALYTQASLCMPNGRILRTRLNTSLDISSKASIEGGSVYGTPNGFRGFAAPGKGVAVDLAGEYSMTRHWVVVSEILFQHRGSTHVSLNPTVSQSNVTGYHTDLSSGFSTVVFPAIEYNFTAALGVIVGAKITMFGSNSTASLGPVMAINYVR
jgi:hypothetical protein